MAKHKDEESEVKPKAHKAEKAPKEEKPKLTGVERFRDEFGLAGELKPLKWTKPSGSIFRISGKDGVLCYEDGDIVELPASEAGVLCGELKALRPNDQIQLI